MRTFAILCLLITLLSCLSFGLCAEETTEATVDNVTTATTTKEAEDGTKKVIKTLATTKNDERKVTKTVETIYNFEDGAVVSAEEKDFEPDNNEPRKTILTVGTTVTTTEVRADGVKTVTKVEVDADGIKTVTTKVGEDEPIVKKFAADGTPIEEEKKEEEKEEEKKEEKKVEEEKDGKKKVDYKKKAFKASAYVSGAFAGSIVLAYLWNLASPKASFDALGSGFLGYIYWFLDNGETPAAAAVEDAENKENNGEEEDADENDEEEEEAKDDAKKSDNTKTSGKSTPANTPNTVGGNKKSTKASEAAHSNEPGVHESSALVASTAAVFAILALFA